VDRRGDVQPEISGVVVLTPIPGTGLSYVSNSPTPILSDSLGGWYACESGVWYAAPSVTGPWSVATSIPASIYSILRARVYYVTHVKIYTVTPTTVVIGYTPATWRDRHAGRHRRLRDG